MATEIFTDEQIREWASNAAENGGSFVKAIATALLMADDYNFSMLNPVAQSLLLKYPRYCETKERV